MAKIILRAVVLHLSSILNRRNVCHALMDAWNARTATLAKNAILISGLMALLVFALRNVVMVRDMSANVMMVAKSAETVAHWTARLKTNTLAEEVHQLAKTNAQRISLTKSTSLFWVRSGSPPKLYLMSRLITYLKSFSNPPTATTDAPKC